MKYTQIVYEVKPQTFRSVKSSSQATATGKTRHVAPN